uniref:Uncharacterized protein n=1 Tax=viral metagenome TaxID=1070528 RepID=A0A6C0CJ03_9ZZZZ
MEDPTVVPKSYPDADARGKTRNLSNLTRQKFYYYGGKAPNQPKVQAKAPVQEKTRKEFIALYEILLQGLTEETEDATGVWEEVAGLLPNTYDLNPYILATAMFIIKRTGVKDISALNFSKQFDRELGKAWPQLVAMLTKVQKKTLASSETVNKKNQRLDVLRYVESFLSFKAEM